MLNVRMFLNKFYIAFSIPLGAPVDECFTAAVTAQSCIKQVHWEVGKLLAYQLWIQCFGCNFRLVTAAVRSN